jgi:Flp pilus assembly protein TadG
MAERRRSLRERGQAVVEFGLIALIFFGLMCGIIDFGRGIWHYNVLSNATREGARYASVLRVQPNGTIGVADCASVRTQVRALSIGLNLPDTSIGVRYGTYTNNGTLVTTAVNTCVTNTITFPRPTGQKPQDAPYYVTISATFNFQLITPIIGNVIGNGGVIPLRSDTMMVTSF